LGLALRVTIIDPKKKIIDLKKKPNPTTNKTCMPSKLLLIFNLL